MQLSFRDALTEDDPVRAPILCARGQHGELVAGPVRDLGGAINITFTCARCGARVIEQSWNVALMKPRDFQRLGLTPR
jgi:hypothetical protein